MRRRRRAFLAGVAGLGATAAATLAAGCVAPGSRAARVDCPATVGADRARIGLVGDVMLGRGVDQRWGGPDRDPAGIWDGMRDRLRDLDGLVCNLECCLSNRGEPRDRVFTFRASPDWAVPALRAGNVTVASLANNHVLDFGPDAFADTMASLDAAGVAHAGAGPDLDAAVEPAVVETGGLTVAVVGMTDQYTAYAAGPDDRGTAHTRLRVDDPHTQDLVRTAIGRAESVDPDLIVATLHWGPNWEIRPSRGQQRFARWLVDRGVDVVHGHSAHVVQGVETYRGRPIVYDAGDFVDDYAVKEDLHNDRSALFELAVADGSLAALDVVPVEIAREAVHPAEESVAGWVRDRVRSLSAAFETAVEREGAGLRIPLDTC
jgi:poly-gamma-glutamate synthesis protein (capsule biosynthesis protein)